MFIRTQKKHKSYLAMQVRIGYNNSSKIPEVFDNPDILNLHDIKRDSNIYRWMSGRHYAAEDRNLCEVAHLA